MKTKMKRTTLVASFAAAGLMIAAPAALAANTLQVGGVGTGGNVVYEAENKTDLEFMTDFGVPTWCENVDIDGYVTKGASVTAGQKIGAITALAFTDCFATEFVPPLPVVVSKKASPAEWGIYVTSTPANKNAPVAVEIRGVSAHMHSTGATPWNCDVNVGLASGQVVAASFNETTQELTINTPGDPLLLDALNGSGVKGTANTVSCAGQIYDGDRASMDGVFTLDTLGAGNITNG